MVDTVPYTERLTPERLERILLGGLHPNIRLRHLMPLRTNGISKESLLEQLRTSGPSKERLFKQLRGMSSKESLLSIKPSDGGDSDSD